MRLTIAVVAFIFTLSVCFIWRAIRIRRWNKSREFTDDDGTVWLKCHPDDPEWFGSIPK